MYLNAISLKNGLRLAFTSELPYSVDKLLPGWNVVTDINNGATINFIGSEVVHIGNQDIDKVPKKVPQEKSKRGLKIGVTTE